MRLLPGHVPGDTGYQPWVLLRAYRRRSYLASDVVQRPAVGPATPGRGARLLTCLSGSSRPLCRGRTPKRWSEGYPPRPLARPTEHATSRPEGTGRARQEPAPTLPIRQDYLRKTVVGGFAVGGLLRAAAGFGWVLLLATVVACATPTAVYADGSLPPQPYRYLHPPPAFAQNNQPPLTGTRVLPVGYMRSVQWFTFTDDGQAGISADKGAFQVSPRTTAVVIRMDPVEIPPGLPARVAADGNAYRVVAVEQPGNKPAALVKHVDITLRWPHLAIGMYEYRDGSWRQICNRNQLIISPSTLSCSSTALGVFLAVTKPSIIAALGSSSSQSWLVRAIPWIIALVVVVVAAVVGFFITRSRSAG